jgi:riboflavin kinase/FMN adenylyltransferase
MGRRSSPWTGWIGFLGGRKAAIIQNFAPFQATMLLTHGASADEAVPVALTIGNFDGVHLGHQAMLQRLKDQARLRRLASCVLTFEPHPREFFAPQSAPTRLTSFREKCELLAAQGLNRLHVERFTRDFAAISPESFVEQVLVGRLKARWILVGHDFRFGARRAGDIDLLNTLAKRHGYEVESLPAVSLQGVRVSSSAVRAALQVGDLPAAEALLGRPYSISGRVVHGDKVGRQLGFATANIQLRHNRPPLTGIYAVRLHGIERDGLPGVASLGVRPTVTSSGRAVLEVHLFDFARELYGMHLRVEFLKKIRDEEKYPDLEMLRAQIARDCEAARAFLANADRRSRT